MGFDIEQVGDALKGKKKLLLIGGGLAALSGIYVLMKRQGGSSGQVVLDSYPTQGGSSTQDLTEIKEGFAAVLEDYQKKNQEQLGNVTEHISQLEENYSDLFIGQVKNVEALQKGYEKQTADMLTEIAKLKASRALPEEDSPTYQASVKVANESTRGGSGTLIGNQGGSASRTIGNGGADYNSSSYAVKKSIEENERKLSTDKSFVESERVRTAEVITYRKSQGMDTSEQEAYAKKLSGM